MSIESKCDWWVLVLYVLPSLKVVLVTTIHQCFMIDGEWRDIPVPHLSRDTVVDLSDFSRLVTIKDGRIIVLTAIQGVSVAFKGGRYFSRLKKT